MVCILAIWCNSEIMDLFLSILNINSKICPYGPTGCAFCVYSYVEGSIIFINLQGKWLRKGIILTANPGWFVSVLLRLY